MKLRILDQIADVLELRATEARTGTTLIEAVAADEFNTQLRLLTTNDEERATLRRMTLALAKFGVTEDELEPMVRNWHTMVPRIDYELAQLKHRIGSIQSTLRAQAEAQGEVR
jgi:hypothetical protein